MSKTTGNLRTEWRCCITSGRSKESGWVKGVTPFSAKKAAEIMAESINTRKGSLGGSRVVDRTVQVDLSEKRFRTFHVRSSMQRVYTAIEL